MSRNKLKTVSPKVKRRVEQDTLKTFREEIPSIYFSDKSETEFRAYSKNAEYTYRHLFKFPPKMFENTSLIDFGAGTGENTVSLARWGANCTLVEMNDKSLAIAKRVFKQYAKKGKHKFVQSSIFDYESPLKYDIVHCRGVLGCTADDHGAFKKIAGFLKPGGFLIYGDPNKAGGFQNMLQRYAIYQNAKSWNEIVNVSEKLFKEDIDRSRSFVNRTRRSIIFDRWVIQAEDDPSVEEVLGWISECRLTPYSVYPPFLMPLVGDSVHHRPKFDTAQVKGMASLAETVWLLQRYGDQENVLALDKNHIKYTKNLATLTGYVENLNLETFLDVSRFDKLADMTLESFENLSILGPLKLRMSEFIAEAKQFIHIVQNSNLDEIRACIDSCKHLFRGACGVRHVDFIAYKEK